MELIVIGLLVLMYLKIDIDKSEMKKEIKDSQDVVLTKLTMDKIEINANFNRVSNDIKVTGKDIDKKIEREIYKLAFTPIEIRRTRNNENLVKKELKAESYKTQYKNFYK